MNYKSILKNNMKFIIAMILVISFGTIGIAFAINIGTFNPIGINIGTATLGADIAYRNGSSATITSTGNLLPVNDVKEEINPSTTNENVLKVEFDLFGLSTNPSNTIMDISLNNISMDCELKSEYFKWKLYRGETLVNKGTFSPKFDTIANGRLVLTNTQEDLTLNKVEYTLLIYLAESCTGDINTCSTDSYNQENLTNKSFGATMKVELSTGNKKTLTRKTSTASACSYTVVAVPSCNTLTYNGSTQTLISTNTRYTLSNSAATAAGNHVVTAKLNKGYKWSDGSTTTKAITCNIAKKDVTITPSAQTIASGGNVVSDTSKITTSGLISGHSISYIYLYTKSYNAGTGNIYASAAKVSDSNGNDVTDNYNFIYNTGTVTIQ